GQFDGLPQPACRTAARHRTSLRQSGNRVVTGDEAAQALGALMMLTLVGSSLFARRLPFGQVARMVAGWVLIFAAVLVGYSYRFELNAVVQRVAGDLLGERGQTVGDTLRVPMA